MTDEMKMGMPHAPSSAVRTAEMVTKGHPDKACDQVADAILDAALRQDPTSRVAIEGIVKDDMLILSGEMTTRADLNVEAIARRVWQDAIRYGPGERLKVTNHIGLQSSDIAQGVDTGGAGDQGIMVGYATTETPDFMPIEYVLARRLCELLQETRVNGSIPWLRPDGKSQVTMRAGEVTNVIIAAHHDESVVMEQPGRDGRPMKTLKPEAREMITKLVIDPAIGGHLGRTPPRVVINGTGAFTVGGPHADAGVVGRKIVIDAYGPRVSVGGGAYSGKDPTKVDRSAAYMCRHIAKTIVAHGIGRATEATVSLAYGIGQMQPEMISAVTNTGRDVSDWVRDTFKDLSPGEIIRRLQLRSPNGTWCYEETASLGHYGRSNFPWEAVAAI